MRKFKRKSDKIFLDTMVKHIGDDRKAFKQINDKMDKFIKRMEPVIVAFEENRIYKMKFKSETGTMVFYVKSILTVGALLTAIWGIIKFLILK